jgi:serine phosphatase RsbU (regulator of sigma subunit)
MKIEVPISAGELIDKLTILEIKSEMISDDMKLSHISKEKDFLENIYKNKFFINEELKNELYDINMSLWKVEDKIRQKERLKEFDDFFVQLARQVYHLNDKRASIKKQINFIYNSEIYEVKSYEPYN